MDLQAVVSFENPSRSDADKTHPDNRGEAFGLWGTPRVYQFLSSIYLDFVILQQMAAK
jgi:hypothetical protein